MKNVRRIPIIALLSILMLLMQACSTGSSEEKENKEGTNSAGNAENGGILKIVRLSDATGLDPHFITDIPSANVVHGKVYETLIALDNTTSCNSVGTDGRLNLGIHFTGRHCLPRWNTF
jgi:peptide/nickel transport system substrate-binding protein